MTTRTGTLTSIAALATTGALLLASPAATDAPKVAPAPATAVIASTPTPGVDYGHGSGAIGSWARTKHVRSLDWQFEQAPVWQYGDSIMVADGRDLAERLGAATKQPLAVDNRAGRPTGPAVDALLTDLARFPAPQVIIMATGTNDIFNPPGFAAEVERVMAAVPATTHVVWVNTYAMRARVTASVQDADLRNSAWVNLQLAAAEPQWANLIVVGWYEFLSRKPTRINAYLADGVHTSTSGRGARNALIVSVVARYLR